MLYCRVMCSHAGLVGLSIVRCLLRSLKAPGLVLINDFGVLTEDTRPKNTVGNMFWAPSKHALSTLRDVNPSGVEIVWLCHYILFLGDERYGCCASHHCVPALRCFDALVCHNVNSKVPNDVEALPQGERKEALRKIAHIILRMALRVRGYDTRPHTRLGLTFDLVVRVTSRLQGCLRSRGDTAKRWKPSLVPRLQPQRQYHSGLARGAWCAVLVVYAAR